MRLIQDIKNWYLRRLEERAERLQQELKDKYRRHNRLYEMEKQLSIEKSFQEQRSAADALFLLGDEITLLREKSLKIHRRIQRLRK